MPEGKARYWGSFSALHSSRSTERKWGDNFPPAAGGRWWKRIAALRHPRDRVQPRLSSANCRFASHRGDVEAQNLRGCRGRRSRWATFVLAMRFGAQPCRNRSCADAGAAGRESRCTITRWSRTCFQRRAGGPMWRSIPSLTPCGRGVGRLPATGHPTSWAGAVWKYSPGRPKSFLDNKARQFLRRRIEFERRGDIDQGLAAGAPAGIAWGMGRVRCFAFWRAPSTGGRSDGALCTTGGAGGQGAHAPSPSERRHRPMRGLKKTTPDPGLSCWPRPALALYGRLSSALRDA